MSQSSHQLPTPVKHDVLESMLEGYDERLKIFLVDGFKLGFHLSNVVFYPSKPPLNLKSSQQFPLVVDEKLEKEGKLGRIAGPFDFVPLSDMVFSPLGLQPKKDPGSFRVIHHLSYPKGTSINDGIPKECATVKYATVTQAIKFMLRFGKGCFLAKTDIKSAFRIVPVHPSNYHLLGFTWRDKFYYDRCLPMGCSSSCSIFEAFSTSLEWIIRQKVSDVAVLHILDDFLFISSSFQKCQEALDIFQQLCVELGVPLAPEKTLGPLQAMSFAGIFLDSVDMSASLPEDKITKFLSHVDQLISMKSATLKQVQSVTGMLNFACAVIEPARAFSRRLYDITIGITQPHHHIKITKSVREDLFVWRTFLLSYNRKSFFLDYRFLSQNLLRFYTDSSSTIGFGGVFGSHWFYGLWSPQCLRLNIALLEIYPIYLALVFWGQLLSNKCVMIMSDNQAVVHILNNYTSKDPVIMIIVRLIVLSCMQNNIYIRSQHLPGKSNVLPDLLSRNQVPRARMMFPFMDPHPVQVPQHLRLKNLLGL